MVVIKSRMSPKGQVVVPKVYRDEYGLETGCIVAFGEYDGRLTIGREQEVDAAKVFEQIAKSIGKKNIKISPHEIEEEYEERSRAAGMK